jgi:two-component system sensor histidine kinase HydH
MSQDMLVMAALVLFFMVLTGWVAGHQNILRPIRSLNDSMRKIAQGDLDHRIYLKTGDEFEELGKTLNEMTIDLKALQEEVKKRERIALLGRIAASLAHDLKHPVRAIENVTALMDKMHGDQEYRASFKTIVGREFVNVNRFLDNLHDLGKEQPLALVELDPAAVINEVLENLAEEFTKYKISVEKQFCNVPPKIKADRFALYRVVSNLVTNAVQAMEAGGILGVEINTMADEENKNFVKIVVRDTGRGIPADRLPSIFDDFVTTKRKGLGLGLAIAKKLVDAQGGRIQVTSKEGEGTRFELGFLINSGDIK